MLKPRRRSRFRPVPVCSSLLAAIVNGGDWRQSAPMIELMRTNDSVLLSFAEALMKEAGIAYFIADANMSVLEGSLGVLPRRLMVEADRVDEARRVLTDAGVADELKK